MIVIKYVELLQGHRVSDQGHIQLYSINSRNKSGNVQGPGDARKQSGFQAGELFALNMNYLHFYVFYFKAVSTGLERYSRGLIACLHLKEPGEILSILFGLLSPPGLMPMYRFSFSRFLFCWFWGTNLKMFRSYSWFCTQR